MPDEAAVEERLKNNPAYQELFRLTFSDQENPMNFQNISLEESWMRKPGMILLRF